MLNSETISWVLCALVHTIISSGSGMFKYFLLLKYPYIYKLFQKLSFWKMLSWNNLQIKKKHTEVCWLCKNNKICIQILNRPSTLVGQKKVMSELILLFLFWKNTWRPHLWSAAQWVLHIHRAAPGMQKVRQEGPTWPQPMNKRRLLLPRVCDE